MTTQPQANSFRAAVREGKAGRSEGLVAKAKKGRLDRSADGLTGVVVPRKEVRRSNQRDGDRHRLTDEKASVRIGRRKQSVELINLSGGGAMIEADLSVGLWDRVELRVGENGTVECAVRWIRGNRIGLEFAHETRLDCTEDERASVLRQVIQRSFTDVIFKSPPPREQEPEASPSESPSADEHRLQKRHPLIWTGELHHDYQTSPVRVRNISSSGAMLECSSPVRVGSEPLLEFNEALSISGTVTWVVGDQVGLRFHSPFDLGALAQSRPDVAPTNWVPPAYLESDAAPESPWDAHWGRMSMEDLRNELEGYLKH